MHILTHFTHHALSSFEKVPVLVKIINKMRQTTFVLLVYLFTCLLVYLFTCLPVYLFTCLPVYLFTCLLVYWFTGLLVYCINFVSTRPFHFYGPKIGQPTHVELRKDRKGFISTDWNLEQV